MEFHVEASPKLKQYIELLLPSMIEQLGLTKSKKLLMVKVDKELEDLGTTVPLVGVDTYLVVLRPVTDKFALGVTLAHELTHVAQMAKGILKITKNGKKWKGKFYNRNHPYLFQPWEVQAFSKQELVFRRAIEL
jgi:hypothetical protein